MKRATISGGIVPIGLDEVLPNLNQVRADIALLKQGGLSVSAAPGTRVEPYGAFIVTYRPYKDGVIDVFAVSLSPDYDEIRLILEEFEDDGMGGITVVNTKDSDRIAVDSTKITDVGSGVFVYEFDFSKKLETKTDYGLLRTFGYLAGTTGAVKNPPSTPPAAGSRVIGDYLITFNSTNGVVVVPQNSAPSNIVKNGAFTYADDTPAPATDLRKWRTVNGGAVISTTHPADDVWWNDANARIAIQKANDGITQGIGKRVRRLEAENIAFSAVGSGPFAADIIIDIQKGGSSVLTAVPTVTASVTTDTQRFNAAMQIDAAADLSGNLDIYIYTTTNLNNDGGGGTGQILYITDIMFCHGKTPQPYAPFPGEGGRGGTDSFDRTITGTVDNADIGFTGKYGFEFGEGGLFLPA